MGMYKEFYADYKRYKNDKQVNQYPCTKIQWRGANIEYVPAETQQLQVGDLIRIKDDEIIPADCVVLASYSNEAPEFAEVDEIPSATGRTDAPLVQKTSGALKISKSANQASECFTKTQTLDGETNLKPKLPIK